MAISYASNAASLRAQGQLIRSTQGLNKSFERLSSGLRINSASDDPAGLAMADTLRAETRLASVALRNANDGISLTSIADSALAEISSMLSRMAELAEQSANGAYTNTQRSALSGEFLALGSEIDRIAKTTEFNSLSLLSASNEVTIQVGIDASENSRLAIAAVRGTLDALGLATSGSSELSFSIIGTTSAASELAAQNALTAVTGALTSLNSSRGTLGAAETRLSTAITVLGIARENFAAAESRIRDADVAQEVAEMVRLQVLQQAQTAVLAQANQQPALALSLLG